MSGELLPPPLAGEGQPRSGRERGRQEQLRERAKSMRANPTPSEDRLWHILRAKRLCGYKFKRQLPVDHFIVDFACLRRRLIVEADGSQHALSAADARRDAYLTAQGFRVLRFWNNDILEHGDAVSEAILTALTAPLPAAAARRLSLPREGGRDEGDHHG